jgi:hypothetical protein
VTPSAGLLAQTVAEWEPGTFVENLAAGPDGSWLVTIPSHRRIDRVDRDGHIEVIAELDRMPTGIVTDTTGALVLAGSIGSRDWQLIRVERDRCQVVRELPDLVFGNGMQRAGEDLLAMDSALGLALRIDPTTGESWVWLRNPLLLAPDSHDFMPGANGVAVHGESVYISNTARALLLRCSTEQRDVAVVAEDLAADDFVVHPDGRIFLATHHGNSVLQLAPDGSRAELAGRAQGVAGSTAVALDPDNPDVLYVTATGGMRGLRDRGGQPARLVRLRLTPSAAA